MGCYSSSKMKHSPEKVRKMETGLFVMIMKFDLNLKEDPKITIESKFTRQNANDLAEPMLPQTSHIIITEFKKFMYLTAIKINESKRTDSLNLDKNYMKNGRW